MKQDSGPRHRSLAEALQGAGIRTIEVPTANRPTKPGQGAGRPRTGKEA